MKRLQAHGSLLRLATVAAGACLALAAGVVQAQSTQVQAQQAQQQAHANQIRDQLRANALRQQQQQQTSNTLRKAFKDNQAREGIEQADQARLERSQAQQRHRVEDYLQREQAAATAQQQAGGKPAKPTKPAPASSSR